jgi:phenylacetate-CoA ligase
MAGFFDVLYRVSPVAAQHLYVSAYGLYWKRLRFGGRYLEFTRAFQARERYSTAEWTEYQTRELRRLLGHAFARVPHYRHAWRGLVTAAQLERFELTDLESLPPLEKETVRARPESLLVDGRPTRRHTVFHTSGSTGTPLRIYVLPEEARMALAVREVRSCQPAGVSFEDPRATFSGREVVPDRNSRGPFHRYNAAERQVYFSAFHLRPDHVTQYLAALRRHRTVWLTGYSNSIYQLASMALAAGLEPATQIPTLRAVITTSEKITDAMRAVVEEAFDTRVFEEYATVENAFFVSENEHGEKLISPDMGILECVDAEFREQPVGTPGEVLATGLTLFGQPLIRLRLGDVATRSGRAPRCGRSMPVLEEVIGRVEDTIYGADGRRLVRFHGIFVDQPAVREGQIVQESLARIRAVVVPTETFSSADALEVERRIRQRIGDGIEIVVECVEAIERGKGGKFRPVVSLLTPEELMRAEGRREPRR